MQLTRVLFSALGLALGVAACNGIGSSIGFSSAGGSVPGPDGIGSGPPSSPNGGPGTNCPSEVPTANTPCSGDTCLYGGSPDPSCNLTARCSADFKWTIEESHCPASCPGHFDDRVPGEACSDPDVCTYLEATCGCVGAIRPPVNAADGGDGGDEGGADASAADAADAADPDGGPVGHWQCVRPGNGCPARRPVTGTRCVKSMSCDYGSCLFGVPLAYECVPTSWKEAPPMECP